MKPIELSLRCYAEKETPVTWYAVCIDLNLIAAGDSFQEAKGKLHTMIVEYVKEAFTNDKDYFAQLIPRKSPIYFRFRYFLLSILHHINKAAKYTKNQLYIEPMPLIPIET